MKLDEFFKSLDIIKWIKEIFNIIKMAFEEMVQNLLKDAQIREFMKNAGDIVKSAVIKADELDIPGNEKNKVAFGLIEDGLKEAGITAARWLINWAIENVVASIRTKTGL